MQRSGILKILFLLIITAAISAGCTDSGNSTPVDNTPQATQTAIETTNTPVETPSPQTEGELKKGDEVNSTDVFGRNYSWCEYRDNITSEMPPNGVVQRFYSSRTERSVDEYNGIPAIHYRYISKGETWSVVTDQYIDAAISEQLGGILINTRDGQINSIENLTAEPLNQENRPFGEKIHTFVYQGTESVTVPAGTYPEARKYCYYNSDNTVGCTYWFEPGIPVPVLYQFSNEYIVGYNGFESHELVAWG